MKIKDPHIWNQFVKELDKVVESERAFDVISEISKKISDRLFPLVPKYNLNLLRSKIYFKQYKRCDILEKVFAIFNA